MYTVFYGTLNTQKSCTARGGGALWRATRKGTGRAGGRNMNLNLAAFQFRFITTV
jgi:hypothetical protein